MKEKLVLKNSIGLIGDSLNTIPIMEKLSDLYDLTAIHGEESSWMYELAPTINSKLEDDSFYHSKELNLSEAFKYSSYYDLHMSQSYHVQFGLPTPTEPIRPKLNIPEIEVPSYDYLLAPFSRSLPDWQKWSFHLWQELGWLLESKGYSVAVLGNSRYDTGLFGLTNEYDRPMKEVLNLLKNCKKGVISVITGISHLCYATETKNYVLSGQKGKWGKNPLGYFLQGDVSKFTIDEVLRLIEQ